MINDLIDKNQHKLNHQAIIELDVYNYLSI
jgi:hypothetical protein